jgi:hypothetical protein
LEKTHSHQRKNAIEVFLSKKEKKNGGFSCKEWNVVVVSHPKKDMFS